jgi:hypothetical protein
MENPTIQDEFGLYVKNEQGKVVHHKYLHRDGGFYIEEQNGKFVLFDCGEYGDYINEDDTYETLEEAFDVGNSWT